MGGRSAIILANRPVLVCSARMTRRRSDGNNSRTACFTQQLSDWHTADKRAGQISRAMELSRITAALRSPIATLVLAFIGLASCGAMVHHVGEDAVIDALAHVRGWLALLLALELGLAGFELLSTRAVLGERARSVPFVVMLRAHLVSHAISTLMPLGRSCGEVSKAALLAPFVGATPAAAVGASGQIIALLVNGAIGVIGGALALAYGSSIGMAAIFLAYGCVLSAIGYLL